MHLQHGAWRLLMPPALMLKISKYNLSRISSRGGISNHFTRWQLKHFLEFLSLCTWGDDPISRVASLKLRVRT